LTALYTLSLHDALPISQAPGDGYEFSDRITGGKIPKEYIPAVDAGIKEAMNSGVLAGYPIVDVKIELTDGSYHEVDSSERAFKIDRKSTRLNSSHDQIS